MIESFIFLFFPRNITSRNLDDISSVARASFDTYITLGGRRTKAAWILDRSYLALVLKPIIVDSFSIKNAFDAVILSD